MGSATGANVSATSRAPLPAVFSRYKDGLEEELKAAVSSSTTKDEESQVLLYRMLQYQMGWLDQFGEPVLDLSARGKALRPTLCLFACEALSGQWVNALPAAAALEFVHNFSLIHDDIQDGDLERRHQPTVWALWGQPHALLAGNAMRSIADSTALVLVGHGVSEGKALQASYLLTRGYLDMTQGQCLDIAFEGTLDISQNDYLTMISCKTGALIKCGMEMGALLGSDEEDLMSAFACCGANLGLAFQIRDDILGIWGDEAATGKSVGNDIRRKKKSFPIVYALEVAGEDARRKLERAYGKDILDDSDVEDVLNVLADLDVPYHAQELARREAGLALQAMEQVPLLPWARHELEDLVEFLSEREY